MLGKSIILVKLKKRVLTKIKLQVFKCGNIVLNITAGFQAGSQDFCFEGRGVGGWLKIIIHHCNKN